MTERSSDMTLAVTLPALRHLADPAAALDDAREWTRNIGSVSAEPNGALTYTRERRIRLDFFSGTRTPAETLHGMRVNYDTERFVLVGVEEERGLAEECGWEFQSVEAAAERAGWALTDPDAADDSGAVGRTLEWIRGVVGR